MTDYKFQVGQDIVCKNFDEKSPTNKGRILHYYDLTGSGADVGYAIAFKPGSTGAVLCQAFFMPKDRAEMYYELDLDAWEVSGNLDPKRI